MLGHRILVLIPHPDDEAVGAALAIRRAVAKGAAVFGLDLTHGCPPREAQWPWDRGEIYDLRIDRRRREAAAAARALGMTRIGDDGLPARRLFRNLPFAYSRAFAALDAHVIDTLWVPAYEGAHADHDCANAIAFALARARPGLAVWEFAEYNFAGGRKRANAFPDRRGGEVTLAAEDEDEAAWKAALLALYRSEAFNLGHVAGAAAVREGFRPLPAHDYARPPHPGRQFRERFHWVPFRVPQIDFTRRAEVTAAIRDFLAHGAAAPGRAA
ncbi:MAG: PIG-L family deacetylase [Rhodospirillaceae bacterium]|nr:PIG-L family deacetylase [Rhodospirillaceae bacterium]